MATFPYCESTALNIVTIPEYALRNSLKVSANGSSHAVAFLQPLFLRSESWAFSSFKLASCWSTHSCNCGKDISPRIASKSAPLSARLVPWKTWLQALLRSCVNCLPRVFKFRRKSLTVSFTGPSSFLTHIISIQVRWEFGGM